MLSTVSVRQNMNISGTILQKNKINYHGNNGLEDSKYKFYFQGAL